MANLDSDGDGFTNGEELQDALGTWVIGQPMPGNPDFVSNPGNPNSVPNTTKAENFALKSGFKVNAISPNPSYGHSNISFTTNINGKIEIDLYNTNRKLLSSLYRAEIQSGNHVIPINVEDKVVSGNYFISFKLNGFRWLEKFNLVH